MIAKKNPKADLERNRFAFFQIGLIVAGSLCLAAFEYSNVQKVPVAEYDIEPVSSTTIVDFLPDDVVEPQPKTERVVDLRAEIEVTEKIIKDPVVMKDPDPEPVIGPIVDLPIGEYDNGGTIIPPKIIYEVPEVDPTFPGGSGAMSTFINRNINLPEYMVDNKGGTVYIQFVVNEDGSIEQPQVLKSVSDEIDKAALDVIARMPKWIPGEQGGKSVRSRLTIPINIILR